MRLDHLLSKEISMSNHSEVGREASTDFQLTQVTSDKSQDTSKKSQFFFVVFGFNL